MVGRTSASQRTDAYRSTSSRGSLEPHCHGTTASPFTEVCSEAITCGSAQRTVIPDEIAPPIDVRGLFDHRHCCLRDLHRAASARMGASV